MKMLIITLLLIPKFSFTQGGDTLWINVTLNDSLIENTKQINKKDPIQNLIYRKNKFSYISAKGINQKLSLCIYRIEDLDDSDENWKYNSPTTFEMVKSEISLVPVICLATLEKGRYNLFILGEYGTKEYSLTIK